MKKREDRTLPFWPYFVFNGFILLIFLLLVSSCSGLQKTAENRDTRGLEKIQIESLKKDLRSILGKTENLSKYRMKKVVVSFSESP